MGNSITKGLVCSILSTRLFSDSSSRHSKDGCQVIVQTINKEQQGSGEIIGISTSGGAVQRWILPSQFIAGLTANFKESANLEQEKMF